MTNNVVRRGQEQLREDAIAIWQAGLAAVRSDALIRENVRRDGHWLNVCDEVVDLRNVERIVVVGAGKAGAGMASGLEQALGERLMAEKNVSGWINVPANCVRSLQRIHLHAARPAGLNEPTQEGVDGTEKMLDMVRGLLPHDLCFCLISGGGSALMPAPIRGISLRDKQLITKHLSESGANIQQLNSVRKQLSRVKGGRLAQACAGVPMMTMIISDVLGDPLDIIGSGPTVSDSGTPELAIQILEQFGVDKLKLPHVFAALRQAAANRRSDSDFRHVRNLVVGNNAVAVDAAGVEAERRGYSHAMNAAVSLEGFAEDVGRHLAQMARRMVESPGPDCLISGGEPVVKLADPAVRGRGGRNQQLALAALIQMAESAERGSSPLSGTMLLSGGTDGEDGPTDAAGAFVDRQVYDAANGLKLGPRDYLERNDAYTFFDRSGGLFRTGPTDTNVCDVRVVVVDRVERQARPES